MRIMHLSDLHIGRQLHFYSLVENQEEVLIQIVNTAQELKPDVIVIAGDIYDKTLPSAEAVTLFDSFLKNLSSIEPAIPVLIIAGNHDNSERLNFASSFLEKHNIVISVFPPHNDEDHLKKITLTDEFGEVDFYLLPFIKPGHVRKLFDEGVVTDYTSAVKAVIDRENIDYRRRNVLISHQFYVSGGVKPETCESELSVISVGGIDSVDTSVIEKFDYVALGHIHGQQTIGNKNIRYCGTPLKYSVSEKNHKKSISMVTLKEKNEDIVIDKIPFSVKQDVRVIKGTLEEVIKAANKENCHDFVSIILTDEKETYRAKEQLEEYYDYILELKIDNSRTRAILSESTDEHKELEPFEAFCEFYKDMQYRDMDERECEVIKDIIAQIGEEV